MTHLLAFSTLWSLLSNGGGRLMKEVFFCALMTEVASASPLVQLLSCTWSLYIKDGWQWALISNVQQPTPATFLTMAPVGPKESLLLTKNTNDKHGLKKLNSWGKNVINVYQLLSSRLCPCQPPLFHKSNESMKKKKAKIKKIYLLGLFQTCCSFVFSV